MLVHDLLIQNGRKSMQRSYLMKIDLQKGYDTVDWCFFKEILEHLEFTSDFVKIFMKCVTTLMFCLMANGTMHGFFKSQRGSRYGDP